MHRLRYNRMRSIPQRPRPAVMGTVGTSTTKKRTRRNTNNLCVCIFCGITACGLYRLPRFCGIYNRIYNHLLPHADARTAINVNRMNHQMCVACVSAHFYIKQQQQQRQQQHQQASNQTNLPANKPHPANLISPTNLIPANLI